MRAKPKTVTWYTQKRLSEAHAVGEALSYGALDEVEGFAGVEVEGGFGVGDAVAVIVD